MNNFPNHQPEFEEGQEQPWLDKISEIAEEAATRVFFYLCKVAFLPRRHRRRYRLQLLRVFVSIASKYEKRNFTSFEDLLAFIASQIKQIYEGLKAQHPDPPGPNPDWIEIPNPDLIQIFLTGELPGRIAFLLTLKRSVENSSMGNLDTKREPFETRAVEVFRKSFFTKLLHMVENIR